MGLGNVGGFAPEEAASGASGPHAVNAMVEIKTALKREFFTVTILISGRGQLVIFEAISQSLFRKLADAGLRNLVDEGNIIRNLPLGNLA